MICILLALFDVYAKICNIKAIYVHLWADKYLCINTN